jgi:hypothetical protein
VEHWFLQKRLNWFCELHFPAWYLFSDFYTLYRQAKIERTTGVQRLIWRLYNESKICKFVCDLGGASILNLPRETSIWCFFFFVLSGRNLVLSARNLVLSVRNPVLSGRNLVLSARNLVLWASGTLSSAYIFLFSKIPFSKIEIEAENGRKVKAIALLFGRFSPLFQKSKQWLKMDEKLRL